MQRINLGEEGEVKNMQNILVKLTNTKTVIGIASAVLLILTTSGVEVNNEAVMIFVKALCCIGVMLGVMNDKGMTRIEWNK